VRSVTIFLSLFCFQSAMPVLIAGIVPDVPKLPPLMKNFPDFFSRRPLIGMVHLGPLPGSPRDPGGRTAFEDVLQRAVIDAVALKEGGANSIMVENFFDAPFVKENSPPHTVAALTRAVLTVREAVGVDMPLGVNVLRNDARSAIAIAHIAGAQFVRINVFVGAAVTDQGIIEGAARTAVLYRRELGADVALLADIFVKHASPLGGADYTLEDAAKDAIHRGLADALIVSGAATGAATDPETVARVVKAVPGVPVLVGSGFDVRSAANLLGAGATGAIVGTSLKETADVASRVDVAKVRALREAMV
jgi:membrane complex biogenesis BtpA family protein